MDTEKVGAENATGPATFGPVTNEGEEKKDCDVVENTNPKILVRKGSSSYIRAHDLDIPENLHQAGTDRRGDPRLGEDARRGRG